MNGFLITLFLPLFVLLTPLAAVADISCNRDNADCISEDHNNHTHWLKLKRVNDINAGVWNGSTDVTVSSTSFCAIAYHLDIGDDEDERKMKDYDFTFDGDWNGADWILTTTTGGANPSTIPVSLKLIDKSGVQKDPSWLIDDPDFSEKMKKSDDDIWCRNNNFAIEVVIKKEDIISHASASEYRGNFRVILNGRGSSNNLFVQVDFDIILGVETFIQISGLDDMSLQHTPGSDITEFRQFCVYATKSTTFKIKGATSNQSQPGTFLLNNGSGVIPYQLSIGDSAGGNNIALVEGADFAGHSAWRASQSEGCAVGGENMRVTLTIQASDMGEPSGVYKDTALLTVTVF